MAKTKRNRYKNTKDVGSLQSSLQDVQSKLTTARGKGRRNLLMRERQIKARLAELGASTNADVRGVIEGQGSSPIQKPTTAEVVKYSNPNVPAKPEVLPPAKPAARAKGSETPFGVFAELEEDFDWARQLGA